MVLPRFLSAERSRCTTWQIFSCSEKSPATLIDLEWDPCISEGYLAFSLAFRLNVSWTIAFQHTKKLVYFICTISVSIYSFIWQCILQMQLWLHFNSRIEITVYTGLVAGTVRKCNVELSFCYRSSSMKRTFKTKINVKYACVMFLCSLLIKSNHFTLHLVKTLVLTDWHIKPCTFSISLLDISFSTWTLVTWSEMSSVTCNACTAYILRKKYVFVLTLE